MNVLLAENLKNPAWQRAPPSDPVFPALGSVGWILMCPTFYQQLHTAARYCTLSALRWIPHFWPRHKGTTSSVFYIHFSLVSAFLRYLILPMLAFSQKQIHLCSKVFSCIMKSFEAVIFFSNTIPLKHQKIMLLKTVPFYWKYSWLLNNTGLNCTGPLICGLPLWLSWQRICLQGRRPGFNLWVGKIPWRRERLPTPVFWPGEFHGLHRTWGYRESGTTERLHFHTLQYCAALAA